MPTYAIGDIQGCLREFDALLDKINFSADDELWLCGDLINRGPNSLGVLRRVKDLSSQSKIVLGNHDLHFLAILFGGHSPGPKDTFSELLEAPDVRAIGHWLRKQKLVHSDKGHIMVHAGLPKIWTSSQALSYAREVESVIGRVEDSEHKLDQLSHTDFFAQMYGNQPAIWNDALVGMDRLRVITNYFSRMRYVDADCTMDFTEKGGLGSAPKELTAWYEQAPAMSREETILFGHWASLDGITGSAKHIALDTGCVWGRSLVAYCLETRATTVQAAYV
jgi:bis(5'-nucleosyl)-tetraphosphatase (symmetrical)